MRRFWATGIIRYLVGWTCCLLLVEGWVCAGLLFPLEVSGGSMAPKILGKHWRFVCGCGEVIRVLVPQKVPQRQVVCSRCGSLMPLSIGEVVPGDRLIVVRTGVWNLPCRRWNIVCYRDLENSRGFAIKRLVGLPGESLAINNGHLCINEIAFPNSERDLRRLLLPAARWRGEIGSIGMAGRAAAENPNRDKRSENPKRCLPSVRQPGDVGLVVSGRPDPLYLGRGWQVLGLGQPARILSDELAENQLFAIGFDLKHQVGFGTVEAEIRWLEGQNEVMVSVCFPPHKFTVWLAPVQERFVVLRGSFEDWISRGLWKASENSFSGVEDPPPGMGGPQFGWMRPGEALCGGAVSLKFVGPRGQAGEELLVKGQPGSSALDKLSECFPVQLGPCFSPFFSPVLCSGQCSKAVLNVGDFRLREVALLSGMPKASLLVSVFRGRGLPPPGGFGDCPSGPDNVPAIFPGYHSPETLPLWQSRHTFRRDRSCKIVWLFLPRKIALKVDQQSISFPNLHFGADNILRDFEDSHCCYDFGARHQLLWGENEEHGEKRHDGANLLSRSLITLAMADAKGGGKIGYDVRIARMVYYFDLLSNSSNRAGTCDFLPEEKRQGSGGAEVSGMAGRTASLDLAKEKRPGANYDDEFMQDISDDAPSRRRSFPGGLGGNTPPPDYRFPIPSGLSRQWHLGRHEFFLLGDNPHLSRDSRHFGPIELFPHRNLLGVVVLKIRWTCLQVGGICFQVPRVLPVDYIE
jgi:hypothetical protein